VPRGATAPTPRAAAWSPDGKILAVAWSDDTLRLHDLRWGTELRRMPTDVTREGAAGGALRALTFDAADPGVVVATDANGRSRAFAWKVDRERAAPPSEPGAVTRVAGGRALVGDSARGRVLTAHDDGTIRAWDTRTGTQVALLSGHAGPVGALRVVGDRIFSLGDDGTVRAWDATTGAELGAASTYGVGLVRWGAPDGHSPRPTSPATTGASVPFDLDAVGVDGRARSWRWTGTRFEDPRVGDTVPDASAAATERAQAPGAAAFGAPRASLAVTTDRAPAQATTSAPLPAEGAVTTWTLGADGKLRAWSVGDPASSQLLATVTPLSDGSWVLDRSDGTRVASPSLRDGSAPSLRP
jgi:WD40 repeat protein